MSTRGKGHYHHGELRDAIIIAALDLLEREGLEALSLRRLARSVGVSPMAPYHHFKDRRTLLAAVATVGFERLQKSKIDNEKAYESVRDAISAGAANYVLFILDNPNLYRLMQGPELGDLEAFPELRDAMAAPARTLVRLIEQLFAQHSVSERSANRASLALWALALGIGTLALDGQLSCEAAPSLARDAATAMIAGWLSDRG